MGRQYESYGRSAVPAQDGGVQTKFCQTCGTEIHVDAVICPKCGVPCPSSEGGRALGEGERLAQSAYMFGIIGLCLFGASILFGAFLGLFGSVICIGGVVCGVIGRNKALDAKDLGCWEGKAHTGYVMCRIVTIAMGIMILLIIFATLFLSSLIGGWFR